VTPPSAPPLAPTWAIHQLAPHRCPSLMIPLGILGAALATVVARAIERAIRRASSDEAAVDSAGTGRTSGS
jgi:hypothetical protein